MSCLDRLFNTIRNWWYKIHTFEVVGITETEYIKVRFRGEVYYSPCAYKLNDRPSDDHKYNYWFWYKENGMPAGWLKDKALDKRMNAYQRILHLAGIIKT